ncbi:MAG: beta-galactosidase trimerization domain-containing protein [Gemmataceae bacterium]
MMRQRWFMFVGTILLSAVGAARGEIIVAEGEQFQPQDDKGWKVIHQQDSFASHTYGGMWVTHGGLLGAAADSVDSVAAQKINVPAAGKYRVWSKYQAPPYFNYLHQIDITQNGKTVFSHVYGKSGTPRLWSFSAASDELWWPWGVDHDAAEAPKELVDLTAGAAEIRLRTVANAQPAGDRCVDFVLLTTNPDDTYEGYKPYRVGTPFALEALAATKLYLRFQNTSSAPAQLIVTRAGHFQPQYGGATTKIPDAPVTPGQWSEWVNVGPFCRLVHDEGLWLKLADGAMIPVQFARDPQGKELVGDTKVPNGEAVSVPLDITWNKNTRVRASRDLAAELIGQSKQWPKANGGQKPKEILFYGDFRGKEEWIPALKDALGYNTLLPDQYAQVPRAGMHTHAFGEANLRKAAAAIADKDKFLIMSFGDEIGLGRINFKDPKMQEKFRAWLKDQGITQAQLGIKPEDATLTLTGDPKLAWYSNLFNEEERFAAFRANTELVRELIGPHALTGANYSPHHLALCYGPVYQWVDIFKHNGMSMIWAEDYIFSVPEVPAILSWMFGQMRCGAKYNQQPIHFYVMPHAPGQEPEFLRRNMLLSVGMGARHINSFWVAPEENFTENYVAWGYKDSFRVLHDAIYQTGEVEKYQVGGKLRPARVAVVIGKATDFNESRLMIDKEKDPFARRCQNAPAQLNQIICRKDQQMLYLALRHAQHAVDLITEDDITDGYLKNYDVVYFAGEWIDNRVIPKLEQWVQAGGILYATAGIGHLNQFGEPEPAMRKLLGLKDSQTDKNVVVLRTLLELPLLEPMDTITLNGHKIPAIGMRQRLVPDQATVLGTWSDGSAAVTVHELGKGKAFAVGTLAGNTYMKTAVKPIPWARGGRKMVYNPTDFDPAATRLVRLGVSARPVPLDVVCDNPHVEAVLIDHPQGTLLTLVNWTNGPVRDLQVRVHLPDCPKDVRSVTGQKSLRFAHDQGQLTFTMDLAEGDFVVMPK